MSCDPNLSRPILDGLPQIFKVNVRKDGTGQWLENSILGLIGSHAAKFPPASYQPCTSNNSDLVALKAKERTFCIVLNSVGPLFGAGGQKEILAASCMLKGSPAPIPGLA